MATLTKVSETITISIPLTIQIDALVAAITSGMIAGPHGYGYWCDRVEITPKDTLSKPEHRTPQTDEEIARNVIEGGTASFYEAPDSGRKTRRVLTREKLIKGFGRWVVGSRHDGVEDEQSGVVDFDIDAPASDLIIQYALFGEQRYG